MSRQILKSIFLFTIISFAERGINYLITLALSIYLPPEELGKLAYLLTVQAYIYPLILCYTNGAILLHYSKEKDGLNYFYNSTVINFTAFIVIAIITLITGLLINLSSLLVIIALLTISLLEAVRLNYLAYNQAFLNIKKYALTAIFFVITNLIITFIFLSRFQAKYEYRIYAILLSSILVLMLILWSIKFKFNFLISKALMKQILSYGLPLLPHAFGLLAIESLNRYFLDSYGNKFELGLYSFAFTLAAPLGILNTAFITAWTPHLYRLFKEDTESSKNKIVKVHTLYILFIIITAILISVFSKNILSLFSAKYYSSYKYLMVIPFYFSIQAIYVIFSATLFYFKKNRYFIYLSFINIIFSVLINYFLFSNYGISATAYCAILSLTLFTTLIVILSHKTYPLVWIQLFGTQIKNV
jgi:O-antigen/teichoic acid export membrane protein